MTAMIIFLAVLLFLCCFPFSAFDRGHLIPIEKATGAWSKRPEEKEFDFALIVTAYQVADLIPPLVDGTNKNKYRKYILYVVADRCDASRLDLKKASNVRLIKPEKPLDKIASIRLAIDNFERAHILMVILDNDNLISNNYLAPE